MTSTATEVRRDVDGIAHVRAPDRITAFRGQGFAAAQDRLWQMDFDRIRALGRAAAVVGPPAIGSDSFHRRMGMEASARATWEVLGPETRSMLEAYAGGVNAFLDTEPRLPEEFRLLDHRPDRWEPWHSIALYQFRHLAMGTFEAKLWRTGLLRNLGSERVARLWPAVPEVVVDPDGETVRVDVDAAGALAAAAGLLGRFGTDLASNNLAIAPSRTATGRPILAGDPHRAIDLPNVYWQNHLTCTDPDAGFDVIGLSFPGVPAFPHFGHGPSVAWCITHGMADDQDVYAVEFDEAGGRYRFDGGWRAVTAREETIEVRDDEPVVIECRSTHHGPVVGGDGRLGLALRWTALAAPDTTFDALEPMLHARDVDALDRAMSPWVVPVNNVLMADTDGHIAYRMRGRVAVRSRDNGWSAVPGDDPDRDWTRFVDDADQLRWRDPACGFLVTANNRVSAEGPYITHDWANPARAETLTRLLEADAAWTVDAVAALLGDTSSPIQARLAERLRGIEVHQREESAAQRLLVGWDGRMDPASPAAALCGTVRVTLVGVLIDRLDLADDRLPGAAGPSLHTTFRAVNARLAFWLDETDLVPDDALRTAFRLAVRSLAQRLGPDPRAWRWDAVHTAGFVHPLAALRPDLADRLAAPAAVGLGGDNECVWATSTAPPSTVASNGQVARYVFDVGDWDASRWVVPHGVSGNPESKHHQDQLEVWAGLATLPMRYSEAAVSAATVSRLTF